MSNKQRQEDKIFEAIGWVYADCCVTLDNGKDPRNTNMAAVLERAKKDLKLKGIENE